MSQYKRLPLPNQGTARSVVGPFKWSDRPSADEFKGEIIHMSDIGGAAGSLWLSDGVRWIPMNGSVVLGASGVAASAAADTAENVLATVQIPAGLMGLNGRLRVTTLWTVTNSANNKSLSIKLGGVGGQDLLGNTLTTSASLRAQVEVANRGVANSQTSFTANQGGFSASTGANVAGAINTAIAQTLVITGTKASAGETITLESYLVELIIP